MIVLVPVLMLALFAIPAMLWDKFVMTPRFEREQEEERREFNRLFAPDNLESCEIKRMQCLISFKCGRRFIKEYVLWTDLETGEEVRWESPEYAKKLDAIELAHRWASQQP